MKKYEISYETCYVKVWIHKRGYPGDRIKKYEIDYEIDILLMNLYETVWNSMK